MPKQPKPDKYNSTNVRVNPLIKYTIATILNLLRFTVPPLAKLVTKEVFFRPQRRNANGQQKLWLQKAETFTLPVDGIELQAYHLGSGPAILFYHGWSGNSFQFHHFFQPLLDAGYSVIALDAPAHGRSGGRYANYFIFTESLRQLWRHLDKRDLHGIIGHSLGAGAVINFISRENFDGKVALIAPGLKLLELLTETFDRHGVPRKLFNKLVHELEMKYGYTLPRDNPYNLLDKIEKEILIVHDNGDRLTSYDDSLACSEKYGNIHLLTTTGLGHGRILKDRNVIRKVLNHMGIEETKNQVDHAIA